jgi:energy-coupling factor transporter ATP-binding protein EcfA2
VEAGAYLLDEIESAQSEIWAQRVGEGLRRLTAQGRMVVVISHDQTWIANHCDRVVELGADGHPAHEVTGDESDSLRGATFGVTYDGPVSAWPRLAVLAGRWSAPAR